MSKHHDTARFRDSGYPWLGRIPNDWITGEIRRVAEVKLGKMLQTSSSDAEDIEMPYLSAINIQPDGLSLEPVKRMWFSRRECAELSIQSGDVLVVEGGSVGRSVCVSDEITDCYFQNSINRVRACPSLATGSFIDYFLKHLGNEGVFEMICNKATIMHLTAEKLGRLVIAIPPLAVQRAIVSFLDRETDEIDVFISDQNELIALLNERRAATITQAVTKGLKPDLPMKESGVPWIGKVPEHWVVDKGTRIGKVFGSEMVREEDINESSGTQFLKVSSLSVGSFSLQPPRWFVDRYATAPVTDFIVFPKRGAAIFTNKVSIVKEPALLDPNLMGWKPYKGCDSIFFAYVLQLVRLEEIADVSTVPQINTKHIASLKLPKPSLSEQQEIVSYLNHETAEIDAAITDAKEAIKLSKERRAALISAAVTGKIDVQNHITAELGAA